jgi:hypothetical protein
MLDMALHLPLLDVARARTELGWTPRHSGLDALRELIEGLTTGSGGATPPLEATKRPGLRPGVGARP